MATTKISVVRKFLVIWENDIHVDGKLRKKGELFSLDSGISDVDAGIPALIMNGYIKETKGD